MLFKLVKKSVISVSPNDPSPENSPPDFRPKKISEHGKNEDPSYSPTKNNSSSPTPSPQPSASVGSSELDVKKLQEEEETLHKIIVVLCSLGASLVLVAIAIAVLFWKVRKQSDINKNYFNNQNGEDKNVDKNDKNVDDVQDKSDDGTNIDMTVIVNDSAVNDSAINNNLNADVYYVNKESSDKKQSTMSQPSYPSTYYLSIVPTAPTAEEIAPYNELDPRASNFSTPPINLSDPPAYSPYVPSAPPLYSHPHGPIDSDDNSYVTPTAFIGTSTLQALNAGSIFVSDAPTMPEETDTSLFSTAINKIDDDGNDISSFGPSHSQSTL
ncbi:19183_t:CDS:1 [Racocetra fulgida]|uniref:19183_t:CDS:1 n=1 Tax=Racocetra fulgida TaxID=60492 RepID=A0A9N9EXP2_9GLOM|nr:19183_t:CDS:1 [Racocetra fulgida]